MPRFCQLFQLMVEVVLIIEISNRNYNFLYELISINSQPLQLLEIISCAISSDTANLKGTPKISLIKKLCVCFHRSD